MDAIYLTKTDTMAKIAATIGYGGTKFRVRIEKGPFDLRSYWDGGSRDQYYLLDIKTGLPLPLRTQTAPAEFGGHASSFMLEPGQILVRHSTFCGKDMGLELSVSPDNPEIIKALMPPDSGIELSENELFVLYTIGHLKSCARPDEYRKAGFKTAEIDRIKVKLLQMGLLTKIGAITVEGRNFVNQAASKRNVSSHSLFPWQWQKTPEAIEAKAV
jgi:hypothetical protein